MKITDKIVTSKIQPTQTNVVWHNPDTGELRMFGEKGWEIVGGNPGGGTDIDPEELIPLDIPPADTLYYRTYVDDVVYIGPTGGSGSSGSVLLGYADLIENEYSNHKGTLYLKGLKESLESPSAQVGILNELITEISVPDNVTILSKVPSQNLKTIIANNIEEMSLDFKNTLWYTQKEQGPVKLGSLLFGYKGDTPTEISIEATEGIKSINSKAFVDTNLLSIILNDSVEKIGEKAFYNTLFILSFEDGPIYLGKTLYGIKASDSAVIGILDIPEGVKYISKLYENSISEKNGSVSIEKVNIPSTAILTAYPFEQNTLLNFPQILPVMSAQWMSGSVGHSVAYYLGTIQLFKDLLLITGTEWLNNNDNILVIQCIDGNYILEDNILESGLIVYTTLDNYIIANSLTYGLFDWWNYRGFSDSSLYNYWLTYGDSISKTYLTSVKIPNTIEYLEENCFNDCINLHTVNLPLNLVSIDYTSFTNCHSLDNIIYPGTVEEFTANVDFDLTSAYIGIPADYVTCSNGKKQILSVLKYTTTDGNVCGNEYYNSHKQNLYYKDQGFMILKEPTWASYLFGSLETLQSVKIPGYITEIPYGTFSSCYNLKLVEIETGVKVIGGSTFYDCKSLYDINIPNTIEDIKDNSFTNCVELKNIRLSDNLKTIGMYAFGGCTSLTSITIPDNVTSIANDAFLKCVFTKENFINNSSLNEIENSYWGALVGDEINGLIISDTTLLTYVTDLQELLIPDYITNIGNSAFEGKLELKSVIFSDSVVSIGNKAFYNCSSLTSIVIPDSVMNIGNNVFYGCSSLTSPVYNAHCFAYMPTSYSGVYTIPEGIEQIAGGAFSECSSLSSITIPNSVISIGSEAFYGCSYLTSVTIPNSVTSIGKSAFSGCSSLTAVTIPNSVTSIEDFTFSDCSSLNSITIPDSVTSIEKYALSGCSKLTSVIIPNSVTSIGDRTFSACGKLTYIEYTGTISQWEKVIKGDRWQGNAPTNIVHCTDGDITI